MLYVDGNGINIYSYHLQFIALFCCCKINRCWLSATLDSCIFMFKVTFINLKVLICTDVLHYYFFSFPRRFLLIHNFVSILKLKCSTKIISLVPPIIIFGFPSTYKSFTFQDIYVSSYYIFIYCFCLLLANIFNRCSLFLHNYFSKKKVI